MEYKPPKSGSGGENDLLKTMVGPDTVTFDILIVHVPHSSGNSWKNYGRKLTNRSATRK